MNHKLGIDSYGGDFSDEDGAGLSLVWTSDEQSQLDIDIQRFLTEQWAAEVSKGAPLLRRYALNDPYGAKAILPAAISLLKTELVPEQIFCAAGVVGLLNSLSCLANGGLCHANDVYRDLPSWSRNRSFRVTSAVSIKASLDQYWQMLLLENPSLLKIGETPEAFLTDICAVAKKRGGIVVIDESNANYLPPQKSLALKVNQVDNLVVLRGFSKAYGLGALRLGVAICSRNIVPKIRSAIAPLAVSPISLELGAAVWSQGDIMTRLRNRIRLEKEAMKQQLERAGIIRRIDEHSYLPYIFLPEDEPSIQTLTLAGIRGKYHSTAGIDRENCYYRLSVPLHPERVKIFSERITAIY